MNTCKHPSFGRVSKPRPFSLLLKDTLVRSHPRSWVDRPSSCSLHHQPVGGELRSQQGSGRRPGLVRVACDQPRWLRVHLHQRKWELSLSYPLGWEPATGLGRPAVAQPLGHGKRGSCGQLFTVYTGLNINVGFLIVTHQRLLGRL